MASANQPPNRSRGTPTLLSLRKLEEMAKEQGASDEIQKQIELCIETISARENYCDTISTPTSAAIENLIKETRSHPWQQVFEEGKLDWKVGAGMMSGSLESTFLKTLASMSNAKRVLEVGLFTGCGALAMAEALPEDGTVVTCEIGSYLGDLARQLMDKSPHGKKVEIMIGPAKESLAKLAEEKRQFDLVFVDADKPGYIDYYKLIMDNDMLTPRGTILIDNALHSGRTYLSPEKFQFPQFRYRESESTAIKTFNEYVYNDNRVSQVMVPIRDGVLMIRRKEAFEGRA